jgi:hypothetical protein
MMRALALLAVFACAGALADVIPLRSSELRVEDGEVLLSAQFDVTLTPALEQALHKGIPLYFTVDFDLTRPRWYWVDEKIAQWTVTYRVSYADLTRQYRVASGPLSQPFDSLDDVLRFVGRVSSRTVAQAGSLAKDARYDAALRMRLDVSQLPKPFQLNALASHEWQLASDTHRWSFTP